MSTLLEEHVLLDGHRVTAAMNVQSGLLRWESDGHSYDTLDILNDLLSISKSGSSTLTIHTFLKKTSTCCGHNASRVRRDYVVEFSTSEARNSWCRAIQRILDDSGRPKRLLILVNPFAGKTLGRKVFKQVVEPLLKAAGIQITMRETQFQRHAKDLAKSFDLSQYDGIVCVSGDGVLAEVLNGLLERADWERAVKMPLGVVPAGSGNGMAKSVLDAGNEDFSAANATFAIIRGGKQALDVATVVQGHAKFHSLLMLSWGFVSDVDFESEKWRCLGGLRIDLMAYVRLLWLRHYDGSLAYVPAPGSENVGDPYSGHEASARLLEKPPESDETQRSWRKNGYSGPLSSPRESDWRTMEGTFIYIWAQNVRYASTDLLSAPDAKFADGYYDLIVIRDCPRWKLLTLLLSMKSGSHVKSKYVQYLKVKAFRLAPGGIVGGSFQGGYVDLDGEVLARGQGTVGDGSNDPMIYGPTIDVTVERGLATIFVPPFSN